MSTRIVQYIAKILLLTLVVCQLGNSAQASATIDSSHSHQLEQGKSHQLELDKSPSHNNSHSIDDSETTCCVDDDEDRRLVELPLDLYLPQLQYITNFARTVTSETNRRFINLKPIFPPRYLIFQSFLE